MTTIEIQNERTAIANLVFGRVIPAIISLAALMQLLAVPFAGLSDRNAIPTLLSVLWIVYMGIVYTRRGRYPAVRSMSIGDGQIEVRLLSESRYYKTADVAACEYEGVVNRARVPVATAPFPQDGERILVITLNDGSELRVNVSFEKHAELQEFARGLDL